MTARTWRAGPPPHVGWWNTSVWKDDDSWRWWDGSRWSLPAWPEFTAERAAMRAAAPAPRIKQRAILWTDCWPEGARVPRVDPRSTA